jgi:hypothetical protein
MNTLSQDTHPDVERKQIELLRKIPPWQRLERANQMTLACHALALVGLRHRHPEASPHELRRRLADLTLGTELAARVYGQLPE